jgi:uncharacterized protein CbrC (UPF0167 family)
MTKFEAEYKKDFIVNGRNATAKEKIAYFINSNWIYSKDWNDENWVNSAKEACIQRIKAVTDDLNDLRQAIKLLDSIE